MSTQKPVVVYDGNCSFCTSQIEQIKKFDTRSKFEYVPRQKPGLEKRFPILAQSDFNTGMRLIEPGGTVHVGADAVYQIGRQLPKWRYVAWLYCMPGLKHIARLIYAWIAANRMHLGKSCQSGTCRTKL